MIRDPPLKSETALTVSLHEVGPETLSESPLASAPSPQLPIAVASNEDIVNTPR
ncbi:hypothetical protein [Paenibacillus tianmuensis]|uniref:hypothetical protein n=1 Tax=Paenibacillus tianmuensis TaxID=624147 RepID=UPI001C27DAEB|nr:hypothetical protein [Paenibacillus tianmuensis]